jgi:AcrR family transcriptional regulator
MSSHFTGAPPRRVPQQQRGRRRVERLLGAAECVIAEAGYDAATMCGIARRAGSAVGSLYQFFPNKDAVVEALRARYFEEYEDFWSDLRPAGPPLSIEQLVSRLLGFPIAFARKHPAFLPLLDLPPTAHSHHRRGMIRERIVDALRAGRPQLSRPRATRMAAVVHQIIRGCLTLYARADIENRKAIVEEFKAVLAGYLRVRLEGIPCCERRPNGVGAVSAAGARGGSKH